MKFSSIIFNLGAKFSLHSMKSWFCDATKRNMSPQLSLQHHYVIHKHQSQIKSTETGLPQSEGTREWIFCGTWRPWQLQISPPISQEGEKNPSLLPEEALAKLKPPGGCKEPQQPWAARSTAKGHWSSSTSMSQHCCLWALSGGEITLKYLPVQHLLLLQHPLPAQEQQRLHLTQLRAEPGWGKDHSPGLHKNQNAKPQLPWALVMAGKRSKWNAGGKTHTCSFPSTPCPPCSSACQGTGLHSAQASILCFGAKPHSSAPSGAQTLPSLLQLWSPVCLRKQLLLLRAPGLFGQQPRWACTDSLHGCPEPAAAVWPEAFITKTCWNSKYTCI